jgi:predicted RNA polymerase sigma factor
VQRRDEGALRALVPWVLAGLLRRGEDFDAAEDALQEALLEALRVWPEHPPRDPRAWLTTVATRRLVDAHRSEVARHRREETTYAEPRPATTEEGDDTLVLLFCCCHPDLVRGHLHELDGDPLAAATAYAEAARRATNVFERDHLVRQAARARAAELCRNSRLTERPP